MEIKITKTFWDNFDSIVEWIDWFSYNLDPFPIQVEFLLDIDNLTTIVNTKLSPFSPVHIFNVTYKNNLIGSIVLTVQKEDDSAEVTHLVLDKSIHKTFLSGIALLEIGKFIDEFMIKNEIIYAQTSIPIEAAALDTALQRFNWNKKATLNLYQKVKSNGKVYRRDVIYFEKLFNTKT